MARKIKYPTKNPFPMPDVVTKAIAAPTDGWDAISPLADMDPKRAPMLINWVPRPGWVELRAGFVPWASQIGGHTSPVETVIAKRAPSGERLFAAVGGSIYEITTQQTVTSIANATGFGSNRWQYVNFQVPGGSHWIFLVNGTDQAQQYDGTTWGTMSISGLPGGFSTANMTNIHAAKQRLWFTFASSSIVAFMPTDAITGPIAGSQDMGDLFDLGGSVVAVADWTIDSGEGPNAYVCFISSQGQIAVYQGTDPTNASAWGLVGVFTVSAPIGFRCTTRLGSDVALITYTGLLPLSQVLPYDPSADRSAALTSRIQNAMNQAVQVAAGNFGWQFITFPLQTLGLLNIPLSENSQQVQYVMNMLTGAWTEFNGWNANCFELFKQGLYWGDNNGNVNWSYPTTGGQADFNTAITADMQCAFNWLDDPGRNKRMTMVQPLLTTDGTTVPSIAVDSDFGTSAIETPIQSVVTGGVWDVSQWDADNWSQGLTQFTQWLSANALGKALAIRMGVSVLPEGVSVFDSAIFDSNTFDGLGAGAVTLQVNAFNCILELGGFI